MLGLKKKTDPAWVRVAESDIEELLTDHAWCEQKAANNAISLITQNPGYPDLVSDLLIIAQEEMAHFALVHDIIKARNYALGRDRKDEYVGELLKFLKKDGNRKTAFVDRLLFAALIEARSCERFKVLSENIRDKELAGFYFRLTSSEANHYKVFLGYARKYGEGPAVEKRWLEWLDYEGGVIPAFGKRPAIHG